MKAKIAIVGSGNIGWALKQLLKNDYEIKQGDIEDGFDANDILQVKDFLKDVDAVISAGPFAVNKNISKLFLSLLITSNADLPIEPVDPKITIFFFIKILKVE